MRYSGVQATIDTGDANRFEVLGAFWQYAAIWQHGDLRYEVERFDTDGTFVTDVLDAG